MSGDKNRPFVEDENEIHPDDLTEDAVGVVKEEEEYDLLDEDDNSIGIKKIDLHMFIGQVLLAQDPSKDTFIAEVEAELKNDLDLVEKLDRILDEALISGAYEELEVEHVNDWLRDRNIREG